MLTRAKGFVQAAQEPMSELRLNTGVPPCCFNGN